jgi:hypothetical protein
LAFQFFLPVGNYNVANVDVATRTFDVLNIGKNRFAFDPTISRTYLNPETGLELTGALGVTISAKTMPPITRPRPSCILKAQSRSI